MQRLNKSITQAVDRPVKVMQFGEGNFLEHSLIISSM